MPNAKVQSDFIDLLALANEFYTYRELSQITGLTEAVLNRYAKGVNKPHMARTLQIREILLKKLSLEFMIAKCLKEKDGYLDTTEIRGNTGLLKIACFAVVNKYSGRNVTKVMSTGQESDHFASMIADRFNLPLVPVMESEEKGIDSYSVPYGVDQRRRVASLYVPKSSVKPYDSFLVTSLLIDNGRVERSLVNLIKERAKLTGVLGLISYGNEHENLLRDVCPEILYKVPAKSK
jgi:adenine/guanine phosphoribosyltransferase-like PRPP-binding protein